MRSPAGGDDFLPKPVQVEELLQKIAQHLDLTWIYEEVEALESASNGDVPHAADAPSGTATPPLDDLEHLLDLARQGLLNRIVSEAQQLRQRQPECEAFCQEIEAFAKRFDVKRIRHRLETLLQQSEPSV